VASATVRNAKRTSGSTNVGSARAIGNIAANSFYGIYLGAQSKVDITEPYSLGTTGTATCPNNSEGAYLAAAPGVAPPAALKQASVIAPFPLQIVSTDACSTSGRSAVPVPPLTAPALQQVLAMLTAAELRKIAVSVGGGPNDTSDAGSPVGSGSADSDGSNVSTGTSQVEISIPATGTGTESTTGEAPGSGTGGDTSTGSDTGYTDTGTTAGSTTDAATSESATAGTGSDTTTASDSGYVDTRIPTTDTETGSDTSAGSDTGYTDTGTTAGSTSDAATTESPAPTSSGKCCICQYQERAECGPIKTSSECAEKKIGEILDCRWDATEGICRSRFHAFCLSYKAEKEQSNDCPGGVHVIDDTKDITTLKLSCSQIEWQRDGHDKNCELTGTAIKACLECSSGDCSFVNTGCSVLQDWSEVERLIESVKSQLKEGREVTLIAHQAVSSDRVCSRTTIKITNESSTVTYPLCKDLGRTIGSLKHWCLQLGETARCQMADGSLVWAKCCPTKQFHGVFPIRTCDEDKAWTPISWDGVGSPPTCSNVAVTHATCRAEGPNSTPETKREVDNQALECIKKASDDCLRSAGDFFRGKLKASFDEIRPFAGDDRPYWLEWPWRCEKRMNAVSCSSWDSPPPPWDPPAPN
jgi:hypothetical protein